MKVYSNEMTDYKKLIESWPKRWRTRRAAENSDLIEFLNASYPNVPLNIQLDCLVSGTSPYCVVCAKPLKLARNGTCSRECMAVILSQNSDQRIEKYKDTMIERYGVDNVRKIPGMGDRIKNTMLEKYGALVSDKSRESARSRASDLNKRGRETLKAKYGVDNPGQLPDHGDKVKATMFEHFGVQHYTMTDEYQESLAQKRIDRFGSMCPNSIEVIGTTDDLEKQEIFDGPCKVIHFKCLICNTTEELPSETFKWRIRSTGTSCQKCSGISTGSLKEQEVRDFLTNSLGLEVKSNQRILEGGLEIDILIPSLNIGIEFDGLFWHNDLRLDPKYHANKTKLAAERGIRLIHIFEDEWIHRRAIVESRLRSLTKKIDRVIHARKCEIRSVSPLDERVFLEDNHIQGYSKSSVKLGLYYNEQLVSLMTFSRPNASKGQRRSDGGWELLRFCSLKNTIVVGGASKLFKRFVNENNPITVLSFADSRWSVGDLYRSLNFDSAGHTSINYWYIDVKKGRRLHRYGLRKNSSDDQTLTEYENRLKQGYLRIWDCGSTKWVWTKK
jgi:predicted nucleic acid-binding Zn ribbon protein